MTAVAGFDRDSESSPATPSGVVGKAGSPGSDGLIVTGVRGEDGASSAPTSAALRTQAEQPRASTLPSEDDLLDVLYEVLAQGVPPRSSLSREEIERFLHQHARERKPIGDMLAFFERHGLPLDASEYGADRELRELASGLQKERGSLIAGFGPSHELVHPSAPTSDFGSRAEEPRLSTLPPAPVTAAAVAPAGETGPFPALAPAAPGVEDESTGRRQLSPLTVTTASGPNKLRWLALVAAVLAIALLASVFVVNQQRASELEQRLDQARMQQRSTDDALTKLEQRAQTLQGALEQSEQAHRQEATRLETTLEVEKQQRATEEMAVERMLGPRYLKLRQKLSRPCRPSFRPPSKGICPSAALVGQVMWRGPRTAVPLHTSFVRSSAEAARAVPPT
jgi:hypothetical protein